MKTANPDRDYLYQVYRRIKNSIDKNGKQLCCATWRNDSASFYEWHEQQVKSQENRCWYCGLPGDTGQYYHRHFRPDKKGICRRGLHLEVDRKENKEGYRPQNCVLACYPCNNAKSDVFTGEEFLAIGEAIRKVKRQTP